MCGIAGFFESQILDEGDLKRMTNSIRHRGPDDEGFHFDKNTGTGLGHRRLSILDLSPNGHQPMTYKGSNLWIVFNGEIYNFIEIREELRKKGYVFISDSDTEVILAAYLEWREEAFNKFNGMWALAIYNENEKELILCRDRYGVKPLYYHLEGKQLVFGSEYKVFWAISEKLELSWDIRGIKTALFSSFQLESSGYTLLEKVNNLLPGHYLKANKFGIQVCQWWKTMDHLVEVPLTLEEQAEKFLDLFLDACRLRMRSDVSIGTSLSGGVDSGSVVIALSHLAKNGLGGNRIAKSWQNSFIHSFENTAIDETDYARMVTDVATTENTYIHANLKDLVEDLDYILYYAESIDTAMPDSPWRIYQAQRANGIIVSLDGHGGDEMLGGYDWHISAALHGVPLFSGRFWELLKMKRDIYAYGKPTYSTIKTILQANPIFGFLREKGNTFVKGRFMSGDCYEVEPYYAIKLDLPREWDYLQKVLYRDFHLLILPRILKTFDLLSMAHGVEVRMPFLDYRLVNYAFSLPSNSKIGGGYTKLVLRKAMEGLLPDKVRLRKRKIGFNSPMVEWFRNELREWIEETLNTSSWVDNLISIKKLKNFYTRNILRGRFKWDEAATFWAYLTAIKLISIHNERICRIPHP